MSSPDQRFPLIVIVGPTAVGKTEISLQLAHRLDGEIVSADSRLFYRGMDIGTAKPTPEERESIPHHLIDIADPDQTWSLAQFQQAAAEAIAAIYHRGRLPFLVGGTGQYVRAVTYGWNPPPQPPDTRLRESLEKLANERGKGWLHGKLSGLDSTAAQAIDARNLRRTIRALEVILSTGRRFSEQRGQQGSHYDTTLIGLTRPRTDLYARVDERIESMFSEGLLEEVRSLLDKGYSPELPALSAIGYRECFAILNGQYDIEEAKIQIKRATRMFVRRQANWFKANDPSIAWFSVDANTTDKVEKYIRSRL
jgi:tRNA dimethylallyltransferase